MLKFNWSQQKNKTMHGSMKRVLNIKVYTNKSNNKTKVINIVQTKGFRSLDSSVRDLLHYFKNMEWQKYISHCLTIYLALFDKKYSPVIKIVYVFRGSQSCVSGSGTLAMHNAGITFVRDEELWLACVIFVMNVLVTPTFRFLDHDESKDLYGALLTTGLKHR